MTSKDRLWQEHLHDTEEQKLLGHAARPAPVFSDEQLKVAEEGQRRMGVDPDRFKQVVKEEIERAWQEFLNSAEVQAYLKSPWKNGQVGCFFNKKDYLTTITGAMKWAYTAGGSDQSAVQARMMERGGN